MADKEKTSKSEAEEKQPSGRQSPATLTVPSQQSAPKEKASGSIQERSSCQASPARLPTELSIKVKSQTSRFNTIQNIAETQLISLTDASLDEINTLTAQLDEVHKAFTREHAYFEVTWPEAHLDHHYFTNNIHEKEAHHVLSAKPSNAQSFQAQSLWSILISHSLT